MRSKWTIPMGLAGLLLFVALGWVLNGDDRPVVTSNDLEWRTFDEGMTLAKEQRKKVLVDVYTDWCTWCKKMDAETYPDRQVAQELRANYIVIKLNAESADPVTYQGQTMTSAQFAQAVGVTGYPSTLFLDESQKPITVVPGFAPADRFVHILRYFSGNHYQSTDFESYLGKNGG